MDRRGWFLGRWQIPVRAQSKQPLTFYRPGETDPEKAIQPQMMYTDGGSIPKLGQVFNGFGPWGYAPAYMIHDWLFVARHCNKDGKANAGEKALENMTFEDSYQIIAEAIKALQKSGTVKENDIAASTISSAVAGPISQSLWNKDHACRDPRVDPKDEAAANAAMSGKPLGRSLRMQGVEPAQVVGEFLF